MFVVSVLAGLGSAIALVRLLFALTAVLSRRDEPEESEHLRVCSVLSFGDELLVELGPVSDRDPVHPISTWLHGRAEVGDIVTLARWRDRGTPIDVRETDASTWVIANGHPRHVARILIPTI